jgi:uncharacterized protein YabN with tetrapyrrole methylase and pyrophosphatase domain
MSDTTKVNTPLQDLIKIEIDARDYGFDWPHEDMIIDQAISECEEIRAAIRDQEPSHRIQEEIGDLLHTAISLCLFAGYDPDETLTVITKKFGSRMNDVKKLAAQRGLETLKGQSIEFMLELWGEAKRMETKGL